MGAYRSRPVTSLQDVWREDCVRCHDQLNRWLNLVSSVEPSREVEEDGWTPVHTAVYDGTLSAIDGNDVQVRKWLNAKTKREKLSPLHLCANGKSAGDSVGAASMLLEANADPTATTKNGFTPLHLAAATWNVEMVNLLVDSRYRIRSPSGEGAFRIRNDDVNCFGATPLHVAIIRICADEDESLHVIKLLLQDPHMDVNAADDNGFTPLHYAAFYGHAATAMILIQNSADVTARTKGDETPLHLAVANGRFRLTSLLLQADGVQVNAMDQEGNTAAHYSCARGDLQILELLMTSPNFGSISCSNMYRNTPIHAACYQGRVEVINFLLGSGREGDALSIPDDLLRENIYSETALHAAATNGQSPLLIRTLLLLGKVPVNIQGNDGHTPLHSACWNGNLEATRLLLEHGGDIRIKTHHEQQTCVNWCHQKGYDEMLYMLHQHAEQLVQDLMHMGDDFSSADRPEAWRDLLAEITGLPKPSPMGKIRNITRQRADVFQLRNLLPQKLQVGSSKLKIIDQVASGSFAKVFRVEFEKRIVAAKMYKEGHFHRKSNIDLYCREVSIHSKLQHPHIVEFVGAVVNETPSKFCILTEYVQGGALYNTLHIKKQSLEYRAKIIIAQGVASGMAYLHMRTLPIIHRDLNSHNVLLKSGFVPVIADFGESRMFSDSKKVTDAPRELTLQPGNLRWMAPEIFRQNSTYTLKADVFSFGLLLWEIVTGQIPFSDFEPAAAAAQMAYHHQRPMIPETCPKNVSAVIAASWRGTHRNRPSFSDIDAWLRVKYSQLFSNEDIPVTEFTTKKLEEVFRSQPAEACGTPSSTSGYVKTTQVSKVMRTQGSTQA